MFKERKMPNSVDHFKRWVTDTSDEQKLVDFASGLGMGSVLSICLYATEAILNHSDLNRAGLRSFNEMAYSLLYLGALVYSIRHKIQTWRDPVDLAMLHNNNQIKQHKINRPGGSVYL